jgi:hypothetical protein
MAINLGQTPAGDVLVYEYGARLDPDCLDAAIKQINQARRLYNDLIATIQGIVSAMQSYVVSQAGPEAAQLLQRIDALNEAFNAAKGQDDRDELRRIAQDRRVIWHTLGGKLAEVRQAHKAELQTKYFARIGKNSACDTYQIRCKAVTEGLGWATANAVLDASLVAFKKSIKQGRAPRFAIGSEKNQDTLTLQFTAAGGVSVSSLMGKPNSELQLEATECGPRKYGNFRFRLGRATADTYATGTWQYHRALPDNASVGLARLVRRRIGKDYRWYIQLVVKLPKPITEPIGVRQPLAAIHFGWSTDMTGRRVAGIATGRDPAEATLLQLPTDVEIGLRRAEAIQGERDSARDKIVAKLKAMSPENVPETMREEFLAICRLPVQHVAIRRLHRFWAGLMSCSIEVPWFSLWRREDRILWQAASHIARRARYSRRDFYRKVAINMARKHQAIVIEPLELAEAAKKIEETTGEHTEMLRKARRGRVVAAVYELESAIRWACTKKGTAVLELVAKTAKTCAICGGGTDPDEAHGQILRCCGCGAELDRKRNGSAAAWQTVQPDLSSWIEQHHHQLSEQQTARTYDRALRVDKMTAGRRAARKMSIGPQALGSGTIDTLTDIGRRSELLTG